MTGEAGGPACGGAERVCRGCGGHGASPSSLKKTPGCAPPGRRGAGHLFAAAWPPHPGAGDGITGVPGGTLGCPSQVAGRSRASPSASAAPDVDATKAEFVPCSSALHRARLPVNRAATTTPLQTPGMPSTPQEDKGVFGKKYARELSGPRVSEVRRRDGGPRVRGAVSGAPRAAERPLR